MTLPRTQWANPDKPFRPDGIPSGLYGFISALQRDKTISKLSARLGSTFPTPVLIWRQGSQLYNLFSGEVETGQAPWAAIWNCTTQEWEVETTWDSDLAPIYDWLGKNRRTA